MPIFGTGPKRQDGKLNPELNATPTYLTPTQVPNLGLWLDANDLSTFVIGGVSTVITWKDKSQYGYNFSTNYGSPQLNYGSGVFFNSLTHDTMVSLSSISITNGVTTLFSVGTGPMNPYDYMIVFGGGNNDLSLRFTTATFNPNDIFYNSSNYFDGSVVTGFPAINTNAGFIVDGVVSNLNYISGSYTSTIGLSTRFLSRGFNGYMNEILLYNSVLTDIQRRGIEAYLARKWGLQTSLPFLHPGRPTNAVSGYKLITYNPIVSNFGLWYDAMDTSTIKDIGGNFPPLLPPNALGVQQWNDKSGNNRHMSNLGNQSIGFNLLGNNLYPLVYPNAPFNNLRSSTNPNPTYTGCNISAFFVLTMSNSQSNNVPLLAFTSSYNSMPSPVTGNQLIVNSNSTYDFVLLYSPSNIGLSRFGAASSNNVVQAPYFGSTALIELHINGTQNTIGNVLPSTNVISINGAFVSSSSFYTGNNFNFQYLSLFGGYNFQPNILMSINEVGIFYRTLTTPERTAYETQLIKKWGLSFTAPITYINSLPVTSSISLWIDAYSLNTISTNSVNQVNVILDKSPNNYILSNSGNLASYSSLSGINSLPGLVFTSNILQQYYNCNFNFTNTPSATCFITLNGSAFTTGGYGTILSVFNSNYSDYGVTNGFLILTSAGNTLTFFRNSATATFPYTFGTNAVYTVLINGGNTTIGNVIPSNVGVFSNNNFVSNLAGTFGTGSIFNSQTVYIGNSKNLVNNYSGILGEIILYNRVLSISEITSVNNYLLNKWNISTTISNVPVTSGLNLWLDAYDPSCVITDSNSNVLLWRDKSINNYNFSNNLLGVSYISSPTYTISPNNSLPSVLFKCDYLTYYSHLENSKIYISTLYDLTSFVVYQTRNNPTSEGCIINCMSTSSQINYTVGNGFFIANTATAVNINRSSIYTTISGISKVPNLITAVFNSSFSTTMIPDIPKNYMAGGKNGVISVTNISSFISTIGNGSMQSLPFNIRYMNLGSRVGGLDFTQTYDGYTQEILIYNRTLSFVERQQVESYLMSKWNI